MLKPKYRAVFIILTCLVGLTACFHQLNMQKGMVDFKLNDFRDAFVRLLPEAERGNADAQYAVGYMYYYGKGVYEDRDKATYWIQRAASQRQPLAVAALSALAVEKASFPVVPSM